MHFFLTGFSQGNTRPAGQCLETLILRHGGTVIHNLDDPLVSELLGPGEDVLACIGDKPRTTLKYLLCLCCGILPLTESWLHACVAAGCRLPPTKEHILKFGVSQLNVAQSFKPSPEELAQYRDFRGSLSRTRVFSGCRLAIAGTPKFVKEWQLLVQAGGASLVNLESITSSRRKTVATGGVPDLEAIICQTPLEIPRNCRGIEVVDVKWFIESLVTRRLADPNAFRVV
jgi:hypothetical protein